MTAGRQRRRRRIANRRPNEKGLTLIELLLSITLLAILTGFLAGGVSLARGAFSADQVSERRRVNHAAIQSLSDLLGAALPIRSTTAPQAASVMFDGGQDRLAFLVLSEGRALTGGVYKVVLRRNGDELTADFTPFAVAGKQDDGRPPTHVVLLRGVRGLRIGYFGNPAATNEKKWLRAWDHAECLPDLISINVEFEERSQSQPIALVTALRQG
jgi:general secretion pathway protein J